MPPLLSFAATSAASAASAVALATAAGAAMASAPPACLATSPAHKVVLVELFTSQGCSSCPPADRWLSQLKADNQVVPLSLHVSYWDYIGWKDPFARREFTERQRLRATANGSRSVYTPGVFVQGRELRGWNDVRQWRAALAQESGKPSAARVELRAQRVGDKLEVSAVAQAPARPQARWVLAVAQGGLKTRVTAGENRDEVLGNEHVARSWSGPFPLGTQTLQLSLPSGHLGAFSLVAIVEDGAEVLQVLSLPLAGCGL